MCLSCFYPEDYCLNRFSTTLPFINKLERGKFNELGLSQFAAGSTDIKKTNIPCIDFFLHILCIPFTELFRL